MYLSLSLSLSRARALSLTRAESLTRATRKKMVQEEADAHKPPNHLIGAYTPPPPHKHLASTRNPKPETLNPTPYTQHPTPYTLHPAPYTQHPTPYTLHPAPCTLHPTPYTLHPTPYTPTPLLHRPLRHKRHHSCRNARVVSTRLLQLQVFKSEMWQHFSRHWPSGVPFAPYVACDIGQY